MALQYLGVGLSKTGTSSLWVAMNMLGIRAKHWEPHRLADVVRGKNNAPNFSIYDDCECITDIPHAYFYREISLVYPDLKYILTIRDEDKWFRSMCKHYAGLQYDLSPQQMKTALSSLSLVYGLSTIEEMPQRSFLLKKRFRDWNDQIMRSIPSDKLLVMNICDGIDGWEKLCGFLNVDVPSGPFPNENKAKPPPSTLRKIKTKGKQLLNAPKTSFERGKP